MVTTLPGGNVAPVPPAPAAIAPLAPMPFGAPDEAPNELAPPDGCAPGKAPGAFVPVPHATNAAETTAKALTDCR